MSRGAGGPPTPAILFVCLGNICRSPLAEAALRMRLDADGLYWTVDSAGTGDWHVGHAPDPRAQATARRHGIDIGGYRGRQVEARDFRRFTHIFALDTRNLQDLRALRPADGSTHLSLLLDMVPGRAGQSVADPYYGFDSGFDETWADVMAGADAIIGSIGGRSPGSGR